MKGSNSLFFKGSKLTQKVCYNIRLARPEGLPSLLAQTIRSATQILWISVPASRSSLKTVHRTVFFTLRPSRVQIPYFLKKVNLPKKFAITLGWPAQRDLNPRSSESESAALSNCAMGGYICP